LEVVLKNEQCAVEWAVKLAKENGLTDPDEIAFDIGTSLIMHDVGQLSGEYKVSVDDESGEISVYYIEDVVDAVQ